MANQCGRLLFVHLPYLYIYKKFRIKVLLLALKTKNVIDFILFNGHLAEILVKQ